MSSSDEEKSELSDQDSEHSDKRVRVYLRLRSMNKFETSRRSRNCIELHDDSQHITVDSPLEGEYDFRFHRVFDENTCQSHTFEVAVQPLVARFLEGYNCSLIAYGQGGSGKSYTMMGLGEYEEKLANDSGHSMDDGTHSMSNRDVKDGEGMIARTAGAIFDLIKQSSPDIEYTIRCSYIELFLEKVLDLLVPGGIGGEALMIVDDNQFSSERDERKQVPDVRIDGASELCCVGKSDAISLLTRGNAFRAANNMKFQSEASLSHVDFIFKIEQRNRRTREVKKSVMHMLDLAASETAPTISSNSQAQKSLTAEVVMGNKSISALNAFVRVQARENPDSRDGPHLASKLTRLLRPSFGGNCLTAVILTASPSSYNVGDSIQTFRFGKYCSRILNSPSVNYDPTVEWYQKTLAEKETQHSRELAFLKEKEAKLSARLKELELAVNGDAKKVLVRPSDNGATEDSTQSAVAVSVVPGRSSGLSNDEEIGTICQSVEAPDNVENFVSELLSEVAVLRNKNEFYRSESKKATQELIDAEYEIQIMSQRKSELEHDLRMSQFREKELGVFLRQFRRFYHRLIRHRGAHGTGTVEELISKVPGVPNMQEMIDIDKLLQEKGLIEEEELHDDFSLVSYERHVNDDKNLEVDLLQRELLKVTEQCIELQIALKEERESATTAAVLAQRWGSMKKKLMGSQAPDPTNDNKEDIAKKAVILQQQLDRKNHDLQAIVWKMNELHVVNETFSENMAGREQRVMVLEKKLVGIQKKNGQIIATSHESEKRLRHELERLRALVDGMTMPLWQFGQQCLNENNVSGRINSRIDGGDVVS